MKTPLNLPNLFTKKQSNELNKDSSASDELNSDAPIQDMTGFMGKLDEGWNRAQKSKTNQQSSNVFNASTKHGRIGIRTAAIGLKQETKQPEEQEVKTTDLSKRIDEGWNRSKKVQDIKEKSHIRVKHANIKSVAIGFASTQKSTESSDADDDDDYERKVQDGLRRAQQVKPIEGGGTSKEKSKKSHGIRSAAMGIKPMSDGSLFSSESSVVEEAEKKIEEGIKRSKEVKTILPDVHDTVTQDRKSNRPNIRAAAFGIKPLEETIQKITSDTTDELIDQIERKANEGLERSKQIKATLDTVEPIENKPNRKHIRAAAIGMGGSVETSNVKRSESQNSLVEQVEKKIEDGLNRVRNVKPETNPTSVKQSSNKASIRSAAFGFTQLNGSNDVLAQHKQSIGSLGSSVEDIEKRANDGMKRIPKTNSFHNNGSITIFSSLSEIEDEDKSKNPQPPKTQKKAHPRRGDILTKAVITK